MESACVFEQMAVIKELNQGIKMAEQLRVNLNSPEARDFLIQKILSAYEKALFVLKSGGKPPATHLPESSLTTCSPRNSEINFEFASKKRKASSPSPSPAFEITYKRIHTCNNVAPPTSPEKHETQPTNQHHYQHELSSPNHGEILSNITANRSVNTWGLGAVLPSAYSFPSTPFGFSDDDFESLNFPNHLDDELFQSYSPSFISPATSDSNHLTEYWGRSSALDFLTEPVDLYADFEFNNSCL